MSWKWVSFSARTFVGSIGSNRGLGQCRSPLDAAFSCRPPNQKLIPSFENHVLRACTRA